MADASLSLPAGFAIRNSRDSARLFSKFAVRRAVYAFLKTPEVYWGQGRSQEVISRQMASATICFGVFKLREQCMFANRLLFTVGDETRIGELEDQTEPELAAFARVIGDGERFAYLADVFVLPAYRGLGLGKFVVVTTLKDSGNPALDDEESRDSTKWRWILFASKAKDLYLRLGFENAATGYQLLPGALNV